MVSPGAGSRASLRSGDPMIQAGSGASTSSSGDSGFAVPSIRRTGPLTRVRRRTNTDPLGIDCGRPAPRGSNRRAEHTAEAPRGNGRRSSRERSIADLGRRGLRRDRPPHRAPRSLSGKGPCRSGESSTQTQRTHGLVQRRSLHARAWFHRRPCSRQSTRSRPSGPAVIFGDPR